MTRHELLQRPGVTPRKLARWIREGLPHVRRGRAYHFEPAAVRDWLLAHGYATAGRVVHTLADVGAHFHKSTRAVGYWRAEGMPCRDNPRRYDLDAIAEWLEQRGLARSDEDRERAETARIERETKQLKLDQLRRTVVPLEPIRRLWIRHVNEAHVILDQVPDRVLAELPPATPGKTRQAIRKAAQRIVDTSCQALADALADGEMKGGESDECRLQ
jgi:phage terminase Nu1 subunit (DNA packaging protein)